MLTRILLSLLFFPFALHAQPFEKMLKECRVTGSVTTFDPLSGKWYYTDSLDALHTTQPASSFKIVNLLIALETGVIRSVEDTIRWPGYTDTVLYGFRPEIYHDMPVREAFQVSAGWAFIELAKRIGKDRYLSFLKKCGYGNNDLSASGDDFWNFGPFGVSPVQQVNFLARALKYDVPFSKKNVDLMKSVMVTEDFHAGIISAKTGWTRVNGRDIGWWVGYFTKEEHTVIFATRISKLRTDKTPDFGYCRKSLTRAVLESRLQ